MKIFYGYDDQHYINITSTIFNKCFKNNQLVIPTGDGTRSEIIGFDPYPGILKHILITDYNGNKYNIPHDRECSLSFESILRQLEDMHPGKWFHREGKLIADPAERVRALHQHLRFHHGFIQDEFPEQVLSMQFVKEDAKVLEIGGNAGRNSLILSALLNHTNQLVVLETNEEVASYLVHNLRQNYFDTRVETRALSTSPILTNGWNTIPASLADSTHHDWKPIPTITFEELQAKYNIQFDTIVADCEGALYHIVKDNPDMLNGIRMIIMENDYTDLDEKQMLDSILRLKGFSRTYHQAGGGGPCTEFFYEVWVTST